MRYRELINESTTNYYHGSNKIITQFSLDNLSSGTAINQEGPGIYLTSSRDDAARYGKYIHSVAVKLIKSRMMPDSRTITESYVRGLIARCPDWKDDLSTNWAENPNTALNLATSAIMDGYGPRDYRQAMEAIWYDYYRDHAKIFLSKMVVGGWDGFSINESDNIQHLIIFNPSILTIIDVTTL